MSIKSVFKLDNPDTMMATMTITMTIGYWKQLMEQLPSKYPAWKFSEHISELIDLATSRYDLETTYDS